MLLIFKVKRKQTVSLGTTKRAELQKRATIELCATQALSQQLQQESGMDTLVSGVKNSSKHTVKKKDILISTVRVMRHLSYMLKINMTLQRYHKALNDKYKAAAKTEEK
jgi:hypothetical protein